jgi:hypothetical protein
MFSLCSAKQRKLQCILAHNHERERETEKERRQKKAEWKKCRHQTQIKQAAHKRSQKKLFDRPCNYNKLITIIKNSSFRFYFHWDGRNMENMQMKYWDLLFFGLGVHHV